MIRASVHTLPHSGWGERGEYPKRCHFMTQGGCGGQPNITDAIMAIYGRGVQQI